MRSVITPAGRLLVYDKTTSLFIQLYKKVTERKMTRTELQNLKKSIFLHTSIITVLNTAIIALRNLSVNVANADPVLINRYSPLGMILLSSPILAQ